jgi:predicted ATPase
MTEASDFEMGWEYASRHRDEPDLTWPDFIAQDVDSTGSALAQVKDGKRYPQLTAWGQSLERMSLYRQWHFGVGNPVRHLQRTDLPNSKLLEDCSNLGLVLNRLSQDFDVKQRLVDALRDLYEDVVDFHVSVEYSTVQVFLVEGEHRTSFAATRLSDGTIRYLCLLAILCDPDPPPLVCIEEPELGLHPDLIGRLANLLREASERCQLVVTTHSDGLVDALTDIPESVVVCEKENGSTKLRRLDRKDLEHWLQNYRLGELWSSGELGGNRW